MYVPTSKKTHNTSPLNLRGASPVKIFTYLPPVKMSTYSPQIKMSIYSPVNKSLETHKLHLLHHKSATVAFHDKGSILLLNALPHWVWKILANFFTLSSQSVWNYRPTKNDPLTPDGR